MKRVGVVLAAAVFCLSTALWAQDSSTTTTDNSNAASQAQSDQHKDAAQRDANMADQEKADAKNESTKSGAERDKVLARLDDSSKILNELLAAPDKGIPQDVYKSAKCVAVIPSMAKGGFVFGAEHGRGVATCRTQNGTWSAPAMFVMTGGSWGAQIGGQAVDLVMLVMNEQGVTDLLSSKFKLGANGSVAAGPVGRDASANTDWKMKAEVLTYSRTRGLFAGLTLDGAVIKQDDDSTRALYDRMVGFRPTLTGQVQTPAVAEHFLATVRHGKAESDAAAH
ncbi:MAG TPA: lipid-binding SYLF domain-containing protein [Terriglobales bacterium]|jgi:lipid-binding SYLF domain-containing protein|nr:lipid-binding SYLF domain-containing protein [Terriglobales bacterium]